MDAQSPGCKGCYHFDGEIWLGGHLHVICPKQPGGKSRSVNTLRGCWQREAIGSEGSAARPIQRSLFDG